MNALKHKGMHNGGFALILDRTVMDRLMPQIRAWPKNGLLHDATADNKALGTEIPVPDGVEGTGKT